LLECGFKQSDFDPCVFTKNGIIRVVYVDDTIFSGLNGVELEIEIPVLGYNQTK